MLLRCFPRYLLCFLRKECRGSHLLVIVLVCLIVDANMEVASSDDVAFVEVLNPFGRGLDVQFSFLYVAKRCLHRALSHLAKRDLKCEKWEGRSRGGPFALR